jgi:hypothetical protein
MPALVAGIHALPSAQKDVDGRDISAFMHIFDALCSAMTALRNASS